jgi:hypothetical protein
MNDIRYLIRALYERDSDDGSPLYWSNVDGWVDRRSANTFSIDEVRQLNLPDGGEWTLASDDGRRKDIVKRLTVEMKYAQTNMAKFANHPQSRHNSHMTSYYSGMRDGLLRALDLIDPAPRMRDERGDRLYYQDAKP